MALHAAGVQHVTRAFAGMPAHICANMGKGFSRLANRSGGFFLFSYIPPIHPIKPGYP